MHTDLGRLTQTADGRHVLTFERTYPHPPEKVWRAITDPAHLRSWFASYLDYDRSELDLATEGAELIYRPGPGADQPPVATGRVLRSNPPSVLEYTWGDEILRWELTPDPQGCRLTFTNVFADGDFAPLNAVGWHSGLDRLTAFLTGDDPATIRLESDDTAAADLQARYEKEFA